MKEEQRLKGNRKGSKSKWQKYADRKNIRPYFKGPEMSTEVIYCPENSAWYKRCPPVISKNALCPNHF
jgi:hypothetical protein